MNKPLEILLEALNKPRWDRRHDGLGNAIVSIDLYLKTAREASIELRKLLDKVENGPR